MLGASASAFAQGKINNNHSAFNYPSSNANKNLWFSSATDKFDLTNIQSNLFAVANLKPGDEYPKPDFSVMNEWYEVTKIEYKIFDHGLFYIVTPKVKSRPWMFELEYADADGTIILETSAYSSNLFRAPLDVPIKCGSNIPTETEMETVKKVYVIRKKE